MSTDLHIRTSGVDRPLGFAGRRRSALLVAALLSLLLVSGAGTSHALEPVPPGPPPIVKVIASGAGRVAAASPAAVVACAASGACLLMSAAVLGIVAYSTRDYWVPWVDNQLREWFTFDTGPATFDAFFMINLAPSIDSTDSRWFPEWHAKIGGPGAQTTTLVASVCRTGLGVRYQVNKQGIYEPGHWLTTDPAYVAANPQAGLSADIIGWNLVQATTPANDLDNSVSNPAHGMPGQPAQTADDALGLCNAGDTLEGARAVVTAGAFQIYEWGQVDPGTAPYDTSLGCRRPDGSYYGVSRTSKPADSPDGANAVLFGHCEPGDTVTGGSVSQGGRVLSTWSNPDSGWTWDGTTGVFPSTWSASSSYQGWTADNLGDGQVGTTTDTSWAACLPAVPQWAQNDVGEARTLSTYTLTPNPDYQAGTPASWTVQSSLNGTSWTTVDTQTGLQLTAPKTVSFTPTSGRYWRFNFSAIKTPGAANCVTLSEITITTGAASSPQPAGGGSAYPNCVGVSPACTWVIQHNGADCLPEAAGCVNWTQGARTSPSTYQCLYGPYVMPLSSCYWMERAYETDGAPGTVPNTDGDPDTYTPPAPNWQAQPTPTATSTVTSTVTSSPTQSPTATGTASPTATSTASPTATSSASPSPGTGSDPSTWPGAAGSAAPGSEGAECFPTGWGIFNPVGWVLQPLKCAFIPSQTQLEARSGALRARFDAVGVGPIITAVGGNFGHLSAGGCAGPTMPFNVRSVSQDVQPFNACAAPMSTVAGFTRSLASVVIIVGGGLAFVRALAAGFGFSFSMRAKGGDEP